MAGDKARTTGLSHEGNTAIARWVQRLGGVRTPEESYEASRERSGNKGC